VSIIVSARGRNATWLERTVIQQENYLQQYIYENPQAIPLNELKDGLRLLVLAREFPTGCGPIDALGVDDDGELYIVETKRYKNSDKRQVIAQMLDYGASLWSAGSEAFLDDLEAATTAGFDMGLGPKVRDFFSIDEDHIPGYLDRLRENVARGRFRFVVLMDRIDDRLKTLISFVNTNSQFDVFGVELDFYQHQEFEIIIPNMYGAERMKSEPAGSSRSSRPGRRWDEMSFFEQASDRLSDASHLNALRRLYEWGERSAGEISWGEGQTTGTFNLVFPNRKVRQFFHVNTVGRIAIGLAGEEDVAFARRARETLKAAGVVSVPEEGNLSLRIEEWAPHVEQLTAAFDQAFADS
jgi:hypothetical protein